MLNTDENTEKYLNNVCENPTSTLNSLTKQQRNEALTCFYAYAETIDKRWISESMPPYTTPNQLVLARRKSNEIVMARYAGAWIMYHIHPSNHNEAYEKADPIVEWQPLPKINEGI